MYQVGDEGGLAHPLDIPSGDLPIGLYQTYRRLVTHGGQRCAAPAASTPVPGERREHVLEVAVLWASSPASGPRGALEERPQGDGHRKPREGREQCTGEGPHAYAVRLQPEAPRLSEVWSQVCSIAVHDTTDFRFHPISTAKFHT